MRGKQQGGLPLSARDLVLRRCCVERFNGNGEIMRLNKYISDSGYCSRREADRLIEAGKVRVNGTTAEMGMQIEDGDSVEINGKGIKAPNTVKKVIYAFYKPEGIVTTMADEPDSLAVYLKNKGLDRRVFPVGRLDKDSCGLLLLTNDGELMNNILKTSNNHQKEYVVKVNKDVTDDFIKKMGAGVEITDGNTGKKVTTRRCVVKKNGKRTFTIVLRQGLNRQIRRMCGAFGYEVLSLKRIRIMNVNINGLREGEIRPLTPEENVKLRNLCGMGEQE